VKLLVKIVKTQLIIVQFVLTKKTQPLIKDNVSVMTDGWVQMVKISCAKNATGIVLLAHSLIVSVIHVLETERQPLTAQNVIMVSMTIQRM